MRFPAYLLPPFPPRLCRGRIRPPAPQAHPSFGGGGKGGRKQSGEHFAKTQNLLTGAHQLKGIIPESAGSDLDE